MITWIFLTVIHILESWLEDVVIELKNPHIPEYAVVNRREHFRSAVLAAAWLTAALYAALFNEQYWIVAALIVNRRLFFDYPLILFRDRPRNKYEGNDWWTVHVFRPVFGTNGRLKELAAELGITIFCLYKSWPW